MNKLLTMILLLLVTGCASVTGTKSQPVTVRTIQDYKEVAGVGCTLMNDAGKWFVTTPGSAMVHKSTGDLTVDCGKDGNVGHETIVSASNRNVWGNLIMGGLIGYAVDRNTGAGFDYPNSIVIVLRKIDETVGLATPALSTLAR